MSATFDYASGSERYVFLPWLILILLISVFFRVIPWQMLSLPSNLGHSGLTNCLKQGKQSDYSAFLVDNIFFTRYYIVVLVLFHLVLALYR